ncbi:MAG: protein-glutamate O-methyltransferase CheR [Methylophaga sp.]|nr:protein-glutamate O-methyltransferase CheR [Methylophaga sp.]
MDLNRSVGEGKIGLGKDREFLFSDAHFRVIREFVTENTGIVLTDVKKDMVYGRLSKYIRKNFEGNFDLFCETLSRGDDKAADFLINAITTNLTSFFRENHHFQYLASHILPELCGSKQGDKRIRIWSAGCSTGEEPYSIAITLRENIPDIDEWDVKILATDLDANVVKHASHGIYDIDRISGIPRERQQRWFDRGRGDNEGFVRIHRSVREMITFKRLNLLHSWPMKGYFDIIFCRNVVIYFDKSTQADLFARYADILQPSGYLLIGHSETLYKVSDRFSSLGNTIYKKINAL